MGVGVGVFVGVSVGVDVHFSNKYPAIRSLADSFIYVGQFVYSHFGWGLDLVRIAESALHIDRGRCENLHIEAGD